MDLFGYSNAIAASNSRAAQIAAYNENIDLFNAGLPKQKKEEKAKISETEYVQQGKDAVTDFIASGRMFQAKVYAGKSKAPTSTKPDTTPEGEEQANDPPERDPDPQPEPAPDEEPPRQQPQTGEGEPEGNQPARTAEQTGEEIEDGAQDLVKLSERGKGIVEAAGKFGGAALAVGNLGMNLAADFDGDWKGMNGAEKAGNVISSIGSVMDLGGVAMGPAGLPLVAVGGLVSLIGGITGGIGDIVKESKEKDEVDTEPMNQPKQLMQSTTTAAAGGAALTAIQ
jgi:hypothetical protein